MYGFLGVVVSCLIPLLVGGLSSFLVKSGFLHYFTLNLPPVSPSEAAFPIVWTLLYILMGVASYLIFASGARERRSALLLYAFSLIMNFFWPLIFFGAGMYLVALIWLGLLLITTVLLFIRFFRIRKTAAYLLIPYLLWLLFALYLNYMVYILN